MSGLVETTGGFLTQTRFVRLLPLATREKAAVAYCERVLPAGRSMSVVLCTSGRCIIGELLAHLPGFHDEVRRYVAAKVDDPLAMTARFLEYPDPTEIAHFFYDQHNEGGRFGYLWSADVEQELRLLTSENDAGMFATVEAARTALGLDDPHDLFAPMTFDAHALRGIDAALRHFCAGPNAKRQRVDGHGNCFFCDGDEGDNGHEADCPVPGMFAALDQIEAADKVTLREIPF